MIFSEASLNFLFIKGLIQFQQISFFIKEDCCWAAPKCFIHSMEWNQSCQTVSTFHNFSSKCQFPWLKSVIPRLFPGLENFSLTYFLSCSSLVNRYYIYFKSKSFGNKYQTKNAHISWDHYFFTYLQQVRDSLQAQPGYQNCKITPRLVNNISNY